MAAKRPRNKDRRVSFEIKTERPLSVGEQVFISGNQQMLGNWRADGFPLTRMADNLWAGSAILPGGETIEFKITRGDWDSEEVNAEGALPGNSVLKAGGDTVVRRTVAGWKDRT
jgi:hypothetical protein